MNPATLLTAALGIALGLWGVFAPEPPGLCLFVLAVTPFAALIWVIGSGGRWALFGGHGETRPSADVMIFGPAAALLIRTNLDLHLDGMQALWPVILTAAAVFAVIGLVGDAAGARAITRTLAMAAVGAILGWCLLAQLDSSLDVSPSQPLRVEVIGSHVVHGRGASYYLQLAPWDGRDKAEDISVPIELYDRAQAGGAVCAIDHPGAFHIRWFTVKAC